MKCEIFIRAKTQNQFGIRSFLILVLDRLKMKLDSHGCRENGILQSPIQPILVADVKRWHRAIQGF